MALNRTAPGAAALAVDEARVARLAAAAADVARLAPGAPPLSVHEILRWPGVLAEPGVAPALLLERVSALVEQALTELAAARAREGAKTAAVLEACCAGIEAQVARVAPRIPAIHAAFIEKLTARLRRSRTRPERRPPEAGARACSRPRSTSPRRSRV